MRGKKFYIDSIKMDLHRVVTASGDIRKELPVESVEEFLEHAEKDFARLQLSAREKDLQSQLVELKSRLPNLKDPHERLRWAEDVLTIRARL